MGTSDTHYYYNYNLLHSLSQIFNILSIMLLLFLLLCFNAKVEGALNSNKNVSAFYVFGDSTVDPGNNDFIETPFRSNFPPYGRDFPNQTPTGRFTNGMLTTDYIASYVGLKKDVLPPYLDPNNSIEELVTGVSFASAGSGFDPLTPSISNVIPIEKQMEYFKECIGKLEVVLGKQKTENHLKKAVFFLSAGTNDFVLNYFTLPVQRKSYSILAYQQFLIQHVKEFIQGLVAEGARRIVVAGAPPMGCLPVMITLNSPNVVERKCIDEYSSVARDYNKFLQNELHALQLQLNANKQGVNIFYVDIYGPLDDMIQAPQKYGFDEVGNGCCGTGYIEASFMCNKASIVCPDPTKYVFWDSIHPTGKAYHQLFLAFVPTVDSIINNY
ncbi:hypothetical protein RIF29_41274 [Crotalaria pallida]|uniref:GDSL esterase/lipase n=1 Tax=Crotalaria pallida TaxID=3830 RepID=A0AAN9HRG6_CROPI